MQKAITKQKVIFTEGKTDKAIFEAILKAKFPKKLQDVEIISVDGKENMRPNTIATFSGIFKIKKALFVLDKNDNFDATENKAQELVNWLKQKSNPEHCSYLILPPKHMPGREIEDYLVEKLKKQGCNLISKIQSFVEDVRQKEHKKGKTIFYIFLLLSEKSKWEAGTSLTAGQIEKLLSILRLEEIENEISML